MTQAILSQVNMLNREADALFGRGNHDLARQKYKSAVILIVGEGFEVPLYAKEGGGVRSRKYMDLETGKMVALMGCFTEIARCYHKAGKEEDASVFYRRRHLRLTQ